MGIQESYNRVVEEIQSQTDIISQIRATLANKATSSGGITPSGTLNISENGTFDVTQYASANVNVPSGDTSNNSGGLVVKTGTTTSNVIETGLSRIDYFVIQRTTWNTIGLTQGFYLGSNNTMYYSRCMSVNQYSNLYSYGSAGSNFYSVDGGIFTWKAADEANGGTNHGLSGGTYYWYAFGAE